MRVYLAAPYSARELVVGYGQELTRIGYTVTSTWLDGTHEITDGHLGPAKDFSDIDAATWAAGDLHDLDKAELLVAFTSQAVGGGGQSGGRHVETGYAIALGKPVIVVGEPENIFHRYGAKVQLVPDWHEALIELAARLVEADRRSLPLHRTEAGYPNCSTCDGGGCLDCTDPA